METPATAVQAISLPALRHDPATKTPESPEKVPGEKVAFNVKGTDLTLIPFVEAMFDIVPIPQRRNAKKQIPILPEANGGKCYFKCEPLVEKAASLDNPQFRIKAKTKRIHASIRWWREAGKDPAPLVGDLLKKHTELAQAGKFEELEALCD